jgi:hypothetical protein
VIRDVQLRDGLHIGRETRESEKDPVGHTEDLLEVGRDCLSLKTEARITIV